MRPHVIAELAEFRSDELNAAAAGRLAIAMDDEEGDPILRAPHCVAVAAFDGKSAPRVL